MEFNRSVSSTSAKVTEPLSVKFGVVASSVTAPFTSTTVIVGVSLVPVITTVTSRVAVLLPVPLSSLTVIVYVAVTVSPAARYCVRLLARLKFQVMEPSFVPVWLKLKAELNAVANPLGIVGPVVEVFDNATEDVRISVSSTSANVTDPLSDSVGVEASSVTAPFTSTTVIVGASFVPVMTTVTSRVAVLLPAPLSSVTVIVYAAVTVSPAARYCVRLLARLKFQAIVPSLVPVCVKLKALLNAVAKPLGMVGPVVEVFDKVTDDVRTSVSSTSAKVTDPLSDNVGVAASSVTAPFTSTTVIIGVSLVPVMTTVTSRVAVLLPVPLSSVTVIV